MRKYALLTCVLLTIGALFLQGCSKNEQSMGPEEPEQLSLPSANTMTMDIAFFESAGVDAQSISQGRLAPTAAASIAGTKINFLNAAVRVLFLDVVAYSALAHPVAAFAVAINSVPQYQQDGSWLWTYIYVDNATEYSIFLRGKNMGTYVDWSMEISTNDPAMPLDHFVWFDGEVQNDGQSGYWQFYEPDTSVATSTESAADTPGIACVRIDWENDSAVDRRLAFLINKPGADDENSTLVFEESLEMGTIEFYDAKSDDTGTIIWNRDGSGNIEWPDFNDGEISCWDVQQDDVDCQ